MEMEMFKTVQRLVKQQANLRIPADGLEPSANLYDLGLTSFDAVCLLLAIERAFGVKFPREMLKRQSAASINTIVMSLRAVLPLYAMIEPIRRAA